MDSSAPGEGTVRTGYGERGDPERSRLPWGEWP
jgi:hypothetical protein